MPIPIQIEINQESKLNQKPWLHYQPHNPSSVNNLKMKVYKKVPFYSLLQHVTFKYYISNVVTLS